MRIPTFWPEDPELWFAQIEGQFALYNVTDDNMRYSHVLSRLEPKQAREIKDLITHPPSINKFEAIKKALIQRLTDSRQQQIRQLLEHEELGDRKPSQFLRHLSTLAGTTVSGELLRTLWLGRLPPQMQTILATRADDDLTNVAEQADRIYEVSNKSLVLATTSQTTATHATSSVEELSKQVAALTAQMTKLMKKSNFRDRSRSRSRNRFQHKKSNQESHGACYYHRRFGEEARKCTQPCNYKSKNEAANH